MTTLIDLDMFLSWMPPVTLPAGFAVSPWRRLHPEPVVDRRIVADVTLTVGEREFRRATESVEIGTRVDPDEIMQRKIVPALRDAVAELRAEALIVV